MAEFGEQLKRAREKKGMTQQTLSEKLFVTRQSVSRWESGNRYPDLLMLKQIAKVLEVSTDELLLDEETPKLVQKSPIIVNSVVKNIQIVLYGCIVLLIMIQSIRICISSNVFEEIASGSFRMLWMLLKEIVEAGLLLYAFIINLLGDDTPKKSGIILIGILMLEAVGRVQLSWISLLGLIPFGLGMIGTYDHFIHFKPNLISQYLIFIACIYAIGMNGYNLYVIHQYFLALEPQLFSMLLKCFIYITCMYQSYILAKKRKLIAN